MRTELPCLPLIQERFFNAIKDDLSEKEKEYYPEFEMTMFLQTWANTSLGFGGIGGQAIRSAYTTVVRDIYSGWCGVFFGERLAYKIKDPNQTFNEDVCKFQMKPVYLKGAYTRNDKEYPLCPSVNGDSIPRCMMLKDNKYCTGKVCK